MFSRTITKGQDQAKDFTQLTINQVNILAAQFPVFILHPSSNLKS